MNDNLAAVGAQVIPVFVAATLIAATVQQKRYKRQREALERAEYESQEAVFKAHESGIKGRALINVADTARSEHYSGIKASDFVGTSLSMIVHVLFQTLQFAAFSLCILDLAGFDPRPSELEWVVIFALLIGFASIGSWPILLMEERRNLFSELKVDRRRRRMRRILQLAKEEREREDKRPASS